MSSMPLSASPHPAANRWPLAVPGLYLMGACVLGGLASSVGGGVFTAVLMSDAGRGSLGSAMDVVSWGLRIFSYGVGVVQLVAVALLWRSNAPVRSMAGVALALAGADFALGAATDVGWSFWASDEGARAVLKAVGWINMAVSVVTDALIFETVLRLLKEGSGGAPGPEWTLRAVFWGGWAPRLGLWLVGLFGVRNLLPPWPMFGVRMVIALVISAAYLLALRLAIRVAESAAPAEGAPLRATAAQASPAPSAAGLRNLVLGALWMLVGGGVTAYTYATATSSGGRYVVAYGAIIAGVAQALVGLVQLLRGR